MLMLLINNFIIIIIICLIIDVLLTNINAFNNLMYSIYLYVCYYIYHLNIIFSTCRQMVSFFWTKLGCKRWNYFIKPGFLKEEQC